MRFGMGSPDAFEDMLIVFTRHPAYASPEGPCAGLIRRAPRGRFAIDIFVATLSAFCTLGLRSPAIQVQLLFDAADTPFEPGHSAVEGGDVRLEDCNVGLEDGDVGLED